jgi:hypothetical protein
MYKLIIWKAIWTDSGPETGTDSFILNYKPNFDELYKHLNCDTIQIVQGFDSDISNRTFDMYTDENSKMKSMVVKNNRATKAWMTWQDRTDRMCLPGDFIAGHVAIIKKVKNDRSRSNEAA